MATLVIPTARLDLVLQTPEETLAFIEAMPPADRAEVSPAWIERVRATPASRSQPRRGREPSIAEIVSVAIGEKGNGNSKRSCETKP